MRPSSVAIDSLVSALNSDVDWIREHTRLGQLAARWDGAGRPERLLLRGQDIADAETWRHSKPEDGPPPTQLHLSFFGASRAGAARRQHHWFAGARPVLPATRSCRRAAPSKTKVAP